MKTKWILLLLFVIPLIAGYFYFTSNKNKEFQLTPQKEIINTASNSDVAIGISTNNDPIKAVDEAVAEAQAKMGSIVPKFAYVVFTTGFNDKTIRAELDKKLDPITKVHGLTSSLGILTNTGFVKGEVGAVAVLLVGADSITFGVSGTDLADYTTPQEIGKNAITAAIEDSGRTKAEKPAMVIMNGTPRRNDDMEILDGIAEVIGADVPVIGGTAGNETNGPTWRQITRTQTFSNGLLLTVIYTPRKVGWAFESGFRLTDKGGIATKTDGRVLYEIDGRPALDVYSEWLGPDFMKNLTSLPFTEMAKYTAYHPLARVIRGNAGQLGYYTLHPVPSVDDIKKKTLSLGGPVPNGSELKLFESSWQTILNRAESIPSQALIRGEMSSKDGLFGLMVICRGAYNAVPESEQPKIPKLTNNVVNGMPFLGVISRGEQGPIEGIRNTNANLVESMVVIGK